MKLTIKENNNNTKTYTYQIPWQLYVECDKENYNSLEPEDLAKQQGSFIVTNVEEEAAKDFNSNDWADYASDDNAINNCGITEMHMWFDNNYECYINVICEKELTETQIRNVGDYLTGQMGDGWGEGFEQRSVESYQEDAYEEYEDDDGDINYNVFTGTYDVYAKFWWSHSPRIDLV